MPRRMMMTGAVVLLLTGGVCAQTGSEDDVLRGPDAIEGSESSEPTIVRRGFDGRLERIEGPPEMAAIEALDLIDESQAAVDDALAARNSAIDAILAEHLDLFGRTVQLFQGGAMSGGSAADRRETRRLLGEVRGVIAPIIERGSLRDEIGEALDETTKDEFVRMLNEYDEALAGDGADDAMRPQSRTRNAGRRAGDERRRLFIGVLQEFGSSYQRVVGQRVEDYQELLESLDVDAETKGAIEAAVQGTLSADRDDPEYSGQRVFQKIMGELTPEQRRVLIAELRRLRPERMSDSGERGRDRR